MRHCKTIVVAMLALFAFGVFTAAAQAEEAPFWSVEGTRLGASQFEPFNARSEAGLSNTAQFTLTSEGGEVVTCKMQTLATGRKLVGSAAGNAGTSEEAIEFRECSVSKNGANCKVREPIVTTKLDGELVFTPKKIYAQIWFKPVTGTEFATIEFTGECTFKVTKVTGGVVGELWTDNTKEEATPVEGGEKFQAKSLLIEFPTKPIKFVWSIKGGEGTEEKVETLRAFGEPSVLGGISLTSLPSGAKWSVLR